MARLSFIVSFIVLIFSVGCFVYSKNTSELYFVDINKLVEKYDRTAIERGKYEGEIKMLNSRVDSLVTDWKQSVQEFEQYRENFTASKSDSIRKKLLSKQDEINSYQQSIKKQGARVEQNAMQTVLNDINDYIKRYGDEHGHRIIFGARGEGNIMYANENSDLTAIILKGLNEEFKNKVK